MYEQAPPTAPEFTELQYAVPVTLESFVNGFSIHNFWAPRFWKPRMKALRESNYTILDRDSPNRRIARRLPEEILIAIQQHVMADSLKDGKMAWIFRQGALKAAADEQVFASVDRLSYQGRFMGVGYVDDLEESLIKRYMMSTFGLALIPGCSSSSTLMQLNLTHVFLCIPKRPGHPIKPGPWNPAEHLHPLLAKDKDSVDVPTIHRIVLTPSRYWWSTDWRDMQIVDPTYVANYVENEDSNLARAFRELELELVARESLRL